MMIAGMGFAQMAWKLAQRRGGRLYRGSLPVPRERAMAKSDVEYYRICDKAAASWRATYGERLSGIPTTVRL